MKKKSLTVRIFAGTFLVGTLVYFICSLFFIFNLYSYFEKQLFTELESEENFIEPYVVKGNLEQLKELNTKNRITLIKNDGTVTFDNTVDASKLESHFNRNEFILAKQNGTSKVSRYSSTMTEKTLYFAKLLDSGDVLRISCNQHSVAVLVLGMSQILLVLLVIAIIISAITAEYLAKMTIDPINKINLDDPENACVYEELKPFTKRIAEENFEKDQREELRKQFSANVSHELKTPLTSISGFAEILASGNTTPQETVDFANTIYKESQRMISLVNDTIKLSKLDEKSISQTKEDLSLREIAKQIFETLKPVADKDRISLNITGDSGIISGVRSVIYEMVYNLLDNAIKYNIPDGRVDVNIETAASQINGKNVTKRVTLSVKDTGIGIPENEQERIFERFYRVDRSRSKETGGTGLGLSIVKHAAKYHGATISVISQPGRGSTFTIVFK